MRETLKAALGLVITALSAALKLSASLNSTLATIFDSSAGTLVLLGVMGVGLLIYAYYSLPNGVGENAAVPQTLDSDSPVIEEVPESSKPQTQTTET